MINTPRRHTAPLSDAAFQRCMAVLAAVWPREPLPPHTLRVYRAILAHLPDNLLERATLRCLHSAVFLPKPAELLACAHQLMAEDGTGPPTAEAAWHQVITALRRGGSGALHPLTRQALDHLGGLHVLTRATYDHLAHYERSFKTVYRTLAHRHYLALAGLSGLLPDPSDPDPQYLPDPN